MFSVLILKYFVCFNDFNVLEVLNLKFVDFRLILIMLRDS